MPIPQLPPLPDGPLDLEYLRMLRSQLTDVVVLHMEVMAAAQRMGSEKCVVGIDSIRYLTLLFTHCAKVVEDAIENLPTVQETIEDQKRSLYDQMKAGTKRHD